MIKGNVFWFNVMALLFGIIAAILESRGVKIVPEYLIVLSLAFWLFYWVNRLDSRR